MLRKRDETQYASNTPGKSVEKKKKVKKKKKSKKRKADKYPSLYSAYIILKAEVFEALLYGCMTWSPNKPDYDRLRRVHHSMLLRCLGWRKRKRDDHILSYAHAIAKTASESKGDSAQGDSAQTGDIVCGILNTYGEERLP